MTIFSVTIESCVTHNLTAFTHDMYSLIIPVALASCDLYSALMDIKRAFRTRMKNRWRA